MEITEQSSLLLSQLMSMDVKGDPRRPPPVFIGKYFELHHQKKGEQAGLDKLETHKRGQTFDFLALTGLSESESNIVISYCTIHIKIVSTKNNNKRSAYPTF